MFICHACGYIFEYPITVKECRGEFWGAPVYEEVMYCPSCHGWDFDEYRGYEEEC